METLSKETGLAVAFALLQNDVDPGQWKRLLDATERAAARGANVWGQVAVRPTGLLIGLQGDGHPFATYRAYREIGRLPLAERVARMRQPEVRARILGETPHFDDPLVAYVHTAFHKLFPLGDPPCYEPARDRSVAAIAAREGRTPHEVVYDLLLQRDGRELLYLPILNYAGFDLEPVREMLLHPHTVVSLGDGGAHCGLICDASAPTFLLTHWVRDRERGARLPLEHVVHRQTLHTARLYGLHDRGVLAPGYLADVNVIDFDGLRIAPPEMVWDLPAGGRRLIQKATGYRLTLKRGTMTLDHDTSTGCLPGRLVRGPQPAPRP
jgi:N-acyl-D-aspartate/D-glutamate deacylase